MWMISEVESETELVSFRLQAQLLNCRHTSSFGPLVTCSPVSFLFSLSHFGQQTLHCITPYSLKQFFRSRPSSKCVWPPKKVATSVWSGVWPSDWPPLFIFSQSPSSSPPTLLSPSVHCPLAESHHLLSIWHPFLFYSFLLQLGVHFFFPRRRIISSICGHWRVDPSSESTWLQQWLQIEESIACAYGVWSTARIVKRK